MRSQVNFSHLVLARMKELVDNQTSWHRALWQVGTTVAICEVAEAASATWGGSITSPEALRDVQASSSNQVLRDAGLGPVAVREKYKSAIAALPSKQSATSPADRAVVEQLADRGRAEYLLRWADHVRTGQLVAGEIEVAARLTTAHLLDEGFHKSHIHGWLTNTASDEALEDVLTNGHEMLQSGLRQFDLVLPVTKADPKVTPSLASVSVTPETYTAAFDATTNASTFARERTVATAIRLSFEARDPYSAVAMAVTWMQRLEDRVSVGLGRSGITFGERIVDTTTRKVREFRGEARPLNLPSVQRNGQYLSTASSSSAQARIDDALGMLAANQYRSTPTGIASIWAALEALLGLPGAKGVEAADRLADIVACSFPRAEVTELARRWERQGTDQLATQLGALSTTAEKASLMMETITSGVDPAFEAPKDIAALHRMRQLLDDPHEVLSRVRGYYVATFRRLYYQRNFIMHAGKLDSVSLRATSRTAPQLVAAGIDRLVNASFVGEMEPHALAARARIELGMIGAPGAKPLHELLV